ncbi:hypothetical protein GGS23DRAFT_356386 [Durotheca rogersii]|uniref:uncharacterized protein n=1 Tax=Durotheca rogersii TaxID=419775 RepID=UPI00221E3C47|nr:uncharacterized protein GGS23DRAFT_356386 [Durotheca rogersii]KAI5865820.1 hypothetical protein GGS23DRAFT_356386 [Durotheca rogersii]
MYSQHKIMRRLLGRQNPDPNSHDGSIGVTSSPMIPTLRPSASQDAVYPSAAPVACLDRSADGRTAVLGGRHILKTIRFDGLQIKEGIDVRSIITAQPANKSNASSVTADQLSIKDARLSSHHGSDLTIFTACANGKIFMYDMSRLGSGSGVEFIQSREDSRQINKLDFNPHRGTYLLSGSQDGTVRCFDVKARDAERSGPTFRVFQSYRCNADGVSDVKWAPKDGMIFACATDSGVVLKWDMRKATAPLLKINAHDTQKGASSISWHADGDHLISAGLDSKCYVWDLSKDAEKRQKPKWTISTPAPVTSVSWRPGLWSATAQGRRAAQIAVSYDDGSHGKKNGINSVHVWDLARPTMPYKEIDVFESSPSALLWHDQDLLWTAGPDGFAQCDVAFAPRVMDRQPLSSLAFSPRGEALMVLEERIHSPRPRPTIMVHQGLATSSYSSSPTGQMLSISRSDSEEDVIGSFIGARRRPADRRRAGSRPSQSLSTTPPSYHGGDDKVIPLDQVMKLAGPFKPQQVMAIGRIPAAPKIDMYRHLSQQYLEILDQDLPRTSGGKPFDERVNGIMERYARASERVSQFRLAQTWRILAYAVGLLLSRRSQYHLQLRLARRDNPIIHIDGADPDRKAIFSQADMSPGLIMSGDDTPRKPSSVTSLEGLHHHPGKSLLAEEIVSESNVPTPIARPVGEELGGYRGHFDGGILTSVEEMDSLNLPPAIIPEKPSPRKRLNSASFSTASEDSQRSHTEGYDFYDLEDASEGLVKAIDVPMKREVPMPVSSFRQPGSPNRRRNPVVRHDSDESSTQMFSLSDANGKTSTGAGLFDGTTHPILERAERRGQDSEEEEAEYGSRIRGRPIDESPESGGYPTRLLLERQDSATTEDFMISQTTNYTTDSDPLQPADDYSPRKDSTQEESFPTSLGQNGINIGHGDEPQPLHVADADFLPWMDDPPYPHPIAGDGNPQAPVSPINPYEILSRALAFEARKSTLNASAMILLLKPLVPDDVIDSYQAASIIRQHHSRLMNMKLFVEAALLRNVCVRGWPDGLGDWGENYTAVFTQAQQRVSVGFICTQCHKPREIDRSDVKGPGVWKCDRCRAVVAPCAVCGHRDATAQPLSAVPISEGIETIARPSDEPMLSTWWYCPGCSHGGHATCLQDWHAPVPPVPKASKEGFAATNPFAFQDDMFPETNSDGCCPLDGCGHACLPGRWRNESTAARTEELGRVVREQTRGSIPVTGIRKNGGGNKDRNGRTGSGNSNINSTSTSMASTPVRGDAIEVPQSRAVESVRETLSAPEQLFGAGAGLSGASGGSSNGGGGGGVLSGILSSSPGRIAAAAAAAAIGATAGGSGGSERRKSVKFAGAANERR